MVAKLKLVARTQFFRINLLASEPQVEVRGDMWASDKTVFWETQLPSGEKYIKKERRAAFAYRWFDSFEDARDFLINRAQQDKLDANARVDRAGRMLLQAIGLQEPIPVRE